MKLKVLILGIASLGVFCSSSAQTFEGIIKWKIKAEMPALDKSKKEITKDDANKANEGMNEAQQALIERMNDPEFKKQMDANPQMKAQMEQTLAQMSANKQMTQSMADGGGDMGKMMPTGMTMKFKNGNRVIKMEGGMAAMIGEILYLKQKDQSYRVSRERKSYSVLPPSNKEVENKSKVTKTDEFLTILGYKCRKYMVEANDNNKKTTTYFWTTTEMKDLDYSLFDKMGSGKNNMSLPAGVEGIPLKFEAIAEGGKVSYEVVEIKKQGLDNNEFIIPADFKENKGFGGY